MYFVASTGETFAAILPGREQDSKTVISANRADAKKINGEVLTVETPTPKVVRAITTGVRDAPKPYPNSNPIGMPTTHRNSACWRMMRRNCRGVTPMVFSKP